MTPKPCGSCKPQCHPYSPSRHSLGPYSPSISRSCHFFQNTSWTRPHLSLSLSNATTLPHLSPEPPRSCILITLESSITKAARSHHFSCLKFPRGSALHLVYLAYAIAHKVLRDVIQVFVPGLHRPNEAEDRIQGICDIWMGEKNRIFIFTTFNWNFAFHWVMQKISVMGTKSVPMTLPPIEITNISYHITIVAVILTYHYFIVIRSAQNVKALTFLSQLCLFNILNA